MTNISRKSVKKSTRTKKVSRKGSRKVTRKALKENKGVIKKASRKVSRKVSRKAAKKASRKVSRKMSRKAAKKASRKMSRKMSRKAAKKASRKVSRKMSRKAAKKASRKVSRKVSRKAVKKASRKMSRKAAKKASRKVSRKVSRKAVKKASRKVSRKMSRKAAKKASRKVSRKMSRKAAKKGSRKMSRNVSKKSFKIAPYAKLYDAPREMSKKPSRKYKMEDPEKTRELKEYLTKTREKDVDFHYIMDLYRAGANINAEELKEFETELEDAIWMEKSEKLEKAIEDNDLTMMNKLLEEGGSYPTFDMLENATSLEAFLLFARYGIIPRRRLRPGFSDRYIDDFEVMRYINLFADEDPAVSRRKFEEFKAQYYTDVIKTPKYISALLKKLRWLGKEVQKYALTHKSTTTAEYLRHLKNLYEKVNDAFNSNKILTLEQAVELGNYVKKQLTDDRFGKSIIALVTNIEP